MKDETKAQCKARWAKAIGKELIGKTISKIRYMTEEEVEELGWYSAAVVIVLNDGTLLWPSRDDEGNDAGSIYTTIKELPIIPVIR